MRSWTGKHPIIRGRELGFLLPFFQHLRELQAHWYRLGGRLRLASADDAADYGSGDVDLTVIKIEVAPSQTEQFALTKTRRGDSEDQELGSRIDGFQQLPNLVVIKDVWNRPTLRALAYK